MTRAPGDVAVRALAALGREDPGAFAALLHPDVEIHTERAVHRGRDAATAWAARRYKHLVRRYDVEELHRTGDRIVALASRKYVWRESGVVGDESLVAVVIDVQDERLRRWRVYEDPGEGLEALVEDS